MNDPFVSLGLSERWSESLRSRGITTPVLIQSLAVPVLLDGADAVIRSGTGTGKTLAYLLPLVERLDPSVDREQALILAPTAELAMQIVKEANELFAGTNLRALALIGGASAKRQIEKLKTHPQLLVGTPGRLVELMRVNKLKTSGIRVIVVDEADQTFALGAGGEAEFILKGLPPGRQIVFCSATMPEEAKSIAGRWMKEPRWIEADEEGVTAESRVPSSVEHVLVVSDERERVDTVRRLIRTLAPKSAIVFVNDTEKVGEVESKLQFEGLPIAAIYGDQPKLARASAMRRFREGKLPFLIATDVAARGLDAPNITHIIHFDPPTDAKAYLHRAGRTGRMGKRGVSIMILTPKQRFIATKMAKELRISFAEKSLKAGQLLASSSSTQDPKPAKKQASARTPAVKATSIDRTSERHRDRKNKGAPRWLKQKRELGTGGGNQGDQGRANPPKKP
ncbi:DEAD/DEAH box helicase [Paenibacillus alkalitolerans]|uniref:DEAD/DEAH box helicase n=1 Tax=Paenibacillus alkalitolerans TaxID=2799335 RepID=UPI0018F791F7|nr:DEAD/DEAH box helicase [Paenibacillus alkalitolerans]